METAGSAEENCDASSVLPRGFFLNSCFIVVLVTFFSKLLHSLVGKFARQPRIISELVVGVIIGHIPFLRKLVGPVMADGFEVIEHFSSSLYMFSVGLEMEPLAILQPPGPEAKIAFAGICSTSSLFFLSYYTLNHVGVFRDQMEKVVIRERSLIAFVLMFTAASSPIITRMITELKLGQTDIGRLAIRSGQANDLVCTTFMAINMLFRASRKINILIVAASVAAELIFGRASRKINILIVAASVAAELIFGRFVLWYLIKWANKRNPVGKKIRGLDMTIVVVITQVLCHLSWLFNYDARVNSFLIGLVLPRHGHVPNYLVGRVSYILTSYILPPYVALSATKSYAVPKQGESLGSDIARMTILNLVSLVGKLIGTLIACICNGLHWLEAITLSVTLNMKGHFHIIFSVLALDRGLMKEGSFIVVVVTVLASIVYVPFTISFIIKKVRKVKGGKARLMGLQWYNSASELRITVGLIKPQNVVSSMTLIELIRSGSDSRTLVYTVDMIELTEPRRAALVYKQGTDSVTVADDEVIELREEIGLELKSQTDGCEGIAVSRSLAISSFSDMHDNICCCAQDTLAVLILLPFHRGLKPDGSLDEGHPGFRTVSQENVLRQRPSRRGSLVDRGLGAARRHHSTSEAQVTKFGDVLHRRSG
ncbi:uncharacterized protein A4U43_C08F14060 [Asparagus officinalis]|nr:uncharacterized protein A4U43_C08F14060 [Asparagus officinalis]